VSVAWCWSTPTKRLRQVQSVRAITDGSFDKWSSRRGVASFFCSVKYDRGAFKGVSVLFSPKRHACYLLVAPSVPGRLGKDAPVSVVLDYKTARELVVTSTIEPRLPAVRRFAKAAKAEVPPQALPSSLAAHAGTEPWSRVPPLPSQE
jgi:hypothetical protein